MSRKGRDTAADVSEMAANMAMTVIGLLIFFLIFSMFVLFGLVLLMVNKFVLSGCS
ncbi:hypothetical protein EMIT0232MI5_110206 [Pseudomonas sp. IT-232MI5]